MEDLKLKPYYDRYDKAFETNDIQELAILNQFANDVDIRKWDRYIICLKMAEKDGVDVTHSKELQQLKQWKNCYPDRLFLFSNDEGYYALEQDADVLNNVLDVPLLNWDGIKSAGFPITMLDVNLERLVRSKYSVGVFDPYNKVKVTHIALKKKQEKKQPVQLSLFD